MAPAAAMVSASKGSMNSVLTKLTSLIQQESKLGSEDIQRKMRLLWDELTNMNGRLEKLAGTEDHDPVVKGWMRQVREMTYDLDDNIDVFVRSAAHLGGAKPGFIGKAARKTERLYQNFCDQLDELELHIRQASERCSRYKLDDLVHSRCPTVEVDPHLRAPYYVNKHSLVGMDGPTEEVIRLLADASQKRLKVGAIVGVGGVGKTTLATNVYARLKRQKFHYAAFVLVPRRPDVTVLLRHLLYQIDKAHGKNKDSARAYVWAQAFDMKQLVDELRKFLINKRYFLVIDGLSDRTTWSIIQCALVENHLGSRILVTTCKESLAMSCCNYQRDCIFPMERLSDIEARSLFFRRIFFLSYEESCPPQLLAEISNDILSKCGGMPLAIISMASLLASSKLDAKEAWDKLRYSCGSSLNEGAGIETTRSILTLSYAHVPLHLKACLLYLCMFPEDYMIERNRLVGRWIAEGFISAEPEKDLEEAGEHYLNELINMGLIQSVGTGYDGRAAACKVHDIILDIILSKSVEENFAITYSGSGLTFGLQDKVRRLCLDCRHQWDAFTLSETTASHVRSLTVIGWNEQLPALENFPTLRVLDVDNCGEFESRYFKNIGRLHLLKYLRLQTTNIIELPEEIGELHYLETLDLTCVPMESKLPKSIVGLKKLMYLLFNNMKLPNGFRIMESLQVLYYFKIVRSYSKDYLKEIGNLPLLRTLGLNWCISDEDSDVKVYADILVSSLRKLMSSNLHYLCIESSDGCSLDFLLDVSSICGYRLQEFQMESNYYFPSVPKWMSSLVSLSLLRINIEIVGEDVVRVLGGLPSLRALFLTMKYTASKQGLIFRCNGFNYLKQFDLVCRSNRFSMPIFEPGAMKKLENLRVVFSAQRDCIGNGFQFSIDHLTCLKHLFVEVNCWGARAEDVKAAEDVIRNAVSKHPNGLSLGFGMVGEQHMVQDERGVTVHEKEDQNKGETAADHEIVVEEDSTPTPKAKSEKTSDFADHEIMVEEESISTPKAKCEKIYASIDNEIVVEEGSTPTLKVPDEEEKDPNKRETAVDHEIAEEEQSTSTVKAKSGQTFALADHEIMVEEESIPTLQAKHKETYAPVDHEIVVEEVSTPTSRAKREKSQIHINKRLKGTRHQKTLSLRDCLVPLNRADSRKKQGRRNQKHDLRPAPLTNCYEADSSVCLQCKLGDRLLPWWIRLPLFLVPSECNLPRTPHQAPPLPPAALRISARQRPGLAAVGNQGATGSFTAPQKGPTQ